MSPSWYRRLFSRGEKLDLKATTVKADQGDAEAQFALGLEYGTAQGGVQDVVQAAQWYLKAADQNHSSAQFNLGLMYAKGEGVSQDDAKAVEWIQKAAHRGEAGAQFNLGLRCHRASVRGLVADGHEAKIEAYKWFQLAAAQGYKGSTEAWELVTLAMTREEVAEGNQDAAAFLAAHAHCG